MVSFTLSGRNIALLMLVASLAGCARDVSPKDCQIPDFQCLIDHATAGITAVRDNITMWERIDFWGRLVGAVAALLTTIFVALQDDTNKSWTKPLSLVLSALATGAATFLASLQVSDNADRLVASIEKMTTAVNRFAYEAERLKGGRSDDDVKKAYMSDQKFREEAIRLTAEYLEKYNQAKIEMLRAGGTAARLNAANKQLRTTSPETTPPEAASPKAGG